MGNSKSGNIHGRVAGVVLAKLLHEVNFDTFNVHISIIFTDAVLPQEFLFLINEFLELESYLSV